MKNIILLFCFISFTTQAHAALKWEAKEKTVKLKLDELELQTEFSFVNEGKEPVKITSVRSSCGCTTAGTKKDVYWPGEKGKVLVSMVVGSHVGEYTKTILVETDDKASTTLVCTAAIPELLTIEPKLIHWKYGDKKTKVLKLTPVDKSIRITHVKIPQDGRANLIEQDDGKYELRIPFSESRRARSESIVLETDVKAGGVFKIIELPQTTE